MADQLFQFTPDNAVKGGSWYDNVNLTIIDARFDDNFDADGNFETAVVAAVLTVKPDDEEAEEYERGYTVGSPEQWDVTRDGKSLIALSDQPGLRENCNFNVFLQAMKNAKVPAKYWAGSDITNMVGLYGHFEQMRAEDVIPDIDRSGAFSRRRDDDDEDEDDNRSRNIGPLVITKLLAEPEGRGGRTRVVPLAKRGGSSSRNTSRKAKAEEADDAGDDGDEEEDSGVEGDTVEEILQNYLNGELEDEDSEILRTDVVKAMAVLAKPTDFKAADFSKIVRDADALEELGFVTAENGDNKLAIKLA